VSQNRVVVSNIRKKRSVCRSTNAHVCKLTCVGQHRWSNPNSPKRSSNSPRYIPHHKLVVSSFSAR